MISAAILDQRPLARTADTTGPCFCVNGYFPEKPFECFGLDRPTVRILAFIYLTVISQMTVRYEALC